MELEYRLDWVLVYLWNLMWVYRLDVVLVYRLDLMLVFVLYVVNGWSCDRVMCVDS